MRCLIAALPNALNSTRGLRYTIARLLRYLILVVGIVAVLKGAFELDLTSIAVVFTALSVGIGFGLQYIAADIASGFILLFRTACPRRRSDHHRRRRR